jgi:hypothetical protein
VAVPSLATTLVAADEPFYQLLLTNSGAIHKLELRVDAIPPPPGVLGDYNKNGVVDHGDYTTWRNHLGQAFQLDNEGTGITPGMVTAEDFDFWKSRFGETTGAGGGGLGGGATIPEPTAIVLLLFGAVMMGTIGLRFPRSQR